MHVVHMGTARHRALDAIGALDDDSDELVGLGARLGISSGESAVYFLYPQPHARHRDVSPGREAEIFLHPQTSVLLVVPG